VIKFDKEIKSPDEVRKLDMIFYPISKDEIINKDYTRILKTLEILKKAGKDAKGKLWLTFDGYENDPREIYEIDEIRDFVRYIYNQYNFIFYFLTHLDNNRAVIFACINDFRSSKKNGEPNVNLEIIFDENIKQKTVNAIVNYGYKVNDLDGARRVIYSFI